MTGALFTYWQFLLGSFYFESFEPNICNGLFLARVDTTDGDFIWFKTLGGGSFNSSLTLGKDRSIYIGTNFMQNAMVNFWGRDSMIWSGLYLAKFDELGNTLLFQKMCESNSSQNLIKGIGVDSIGNMYITGMFRGYIAFGSDSLLNYSDYGGGFFVKLDRDWRYLWGRTDGFIGKGLVVDGAGNSIVFAATGMESINSSGVTQWSNSHSYTINNVAMDIFGNSYFVGSFGPKLKTHLTQRFFEMKLFCHFVC